MMSVFEQIPASRSAGEVAHQIEALVLDGVLRAGEQLPPERDLAVETGVSRPIVREAIAMLVEKGILQRRQGDGTFVADIIGEVFTPPIAALLSHHPRATADYLEYRLEVEGIVAGLAAERATRYDRDLLTDCVARMRKAHEDADFHREAEIDVEFHSLIGEMAHNLVFLHTLRSCYRLLSQGIFENRTRLYETEGAREKLLGQHLAIAAAILSGDRNAAVAAARNHIEFILKTSESLERQIERERISGLRLRRRESERYRVGPHETEAGKESCK
jgi:GntR family transcriptional repressor for pyruvate dehydrogenase complex